MPHWFVEELQPSSTRLEVSFSLTFSLVFAYYPTPNSTLYFTHGSARTLTLIIPSSPPAVALALYCRKV